MNTKELSIIIPVYNCQDYILDCVSSILGQKDSEKYEIIIVNDGSTDNSGKILSAIAKDNKNIHIINQKNSGVSVARNNGINASHGKYITFVDADDMVGLKESAFDKYIQLSANAKFKKTANLSTTKTYFLPKCFNSGYFTNDYFTNMLNAAHDTDADVVLGGKITINLNMSYLTRQVYDYDFVYGKCFKDKDILLRQAHIRESANFALYRREKLDAYNLRFIPNMNLDEDILFCMLAVLQAEKVATVKDVTYFYNRRENTLSNTPDYHKTLQKCMIAYIQLFSYLLIVLDDKPEYSKLFNYWIKQYSKKGIEYFYFPGEFPPDDCYYWCEKQECKNCHIAQSMRENFIQNIKRYR